MGGGLSGAGAGLFPLASFCSALKGTHCTDYNRMDTLYLSLSLSLARFCFFTHFYCLSLLNSILSLSLSLSLSLLISLYLSISLSLSHSLLLYLYHSLSLLILISHLLCPFSVSIFSSNFPSLTPSFTPPSLPPYLSLSSFCPLSLSPICLYFPFLLCNLPLCVCVCV